VSEAATAISGTREDAARAFLFATLAAGFSYPDRSTLERLASAAADVPEALRLLGVPVPDGIGELLASAPARQRELEGRYNALFVTGLAAPPTETAYELDKAARRAAELADVLGFYRAFGLGLAAPFEPDHLVVQLEFLSVLLQKIRHFAETGEEEGFAVCERAYRDFLADHPARWYSIFLERLRAADPGSFYGALADLLEELLKGEIGRLGLEPQRLERLVVEKPGPSSWACGAGPGAMAGCSG
jgi:DMSO reductase family type II enzyme chaperone